MRWKVTLVEEVAQEGADARPRVKQGRVSALTRGGLWLRQTELVDELLASNYVSHAPGEPSLSRGGEDIKRIVRTYRSAFPDPVYTVEKRVTEGDMVVTRWTARGTHQGEFMGIPPSGNSIE